MLDRLHRTGFRALWICRSVLAALLALPLGGCGTAATMSAMSPTITHEQNLVVLAPIAHLPPLLLHLPGIAGGRAIDQHLVDGFKDGGFKGKVEIYDWTENNIGLNALLANKRNHEQARKLAGQLTERFDKDPASPIYLTSHSGGGAIAVWMLESLPERVKINTLVLMSPALSPQYDLSTALRHVSGRAYVFSSTEDELVLGTGCRLMGTMDGVKTDAAGRVGFSTPPDADAGQYAKLVPVAYNPEWIRLGDRGDHIGAMNRRFARAVITPLVLSGKTPPATADAAQALLNSTTQLTVSH